MTSADRPDQLRYGAGIEVLSAAATAPDGITPVGTWTGVGEQGADGNIVAADVSLTAGGVHVYRVAVEAHLDTNVADSTAITCPLKEAAIAEASRTPPAWSTMN